MPFGGGLRLFATRVRSGLVSEKSLLGKERAKMRLYSLWPVFDGNLYAYLEGFLTSATLTKYQLKYPCHLGILD